MSALLADYGVQYGVQKRQLATQRDATLAQNAYSRFLAQSRGQRSLDALNRQYDQTNRQYNRGYEGVASSYGQRGLSNSGIRSKGIDNYSQDWKTALSNIDFQRNDTQQGIWEALQGLDMQDMNAWNSYNNNAADIDVLKNAAIMSTAATLDGFRPFLGS